MTYHRRRTRESWLAWQARRARLKAGVVIDEAWHGANRVADRLERKVERTWERKLRRPVTIGALALSAALAGNVGYRTVKPVTDLPPELTLVGREAQTYELLREYLLKENYGLKDAPLHMAMLNWETRGSFNPRALSETGAAGIAQFRRIGVDQVNEFTGRSYINADRLNPRKSVEMHVEYMRYLRERFGGTSATGRAIGYVGRALGGRGVPWPRRSASDQKGLAVIAYNMGEDRVRRTLPAGLILPTSDDEYVRLLEATLTADKLRDDDPNVRMVNVRSGRLHSIDRPVRQQAAGYAKGVSELEDDYLRKIRNYERGARVPGMIPVATPDEDVLEKYATYRSPIDASWDEISKRLGPGQLYGAPRSGGRVHRGVDIGAPRGAAVYPITAARIVEIRDYDPNPSRRRGSWRNGKTIVYKTAFGDHVWNLHLDDFASGLKEGDIVGPKTVIGHVGSTGNASATFPHLHLQIRKGGRSGPIANPLPYLAEGSAAWHNLTEQLKASAERNPQLYRRFYESVDAVERQNQPPQ